MSSVGTWMQKVAQAWLIITMTESRSAFFLGLDSFLGELPLLLLTMVGGVFADRRDRRHMILMSQIVQMLVALVLAMLVYMRRIHIAQVLALSFIVGCVRAFGGPAYESLLPTLVGKEHLPNAIALNSIQFNLAQVIGPFAAGAALAAFGMVACFGLNAISFLFVIAAILALRDVHVPPIATDSTVAQFRGGLRFVQGSPNLVTVMVVGFFAAFLGAPLLTFLPVIIRDVFHRDVGFYTQLMTFSGAGAVMGALIVAWLGKNKHMGRILLILLTLFGMIIVCFGLSRNTYVSALILFSGGSLFVMCSSLATSLAQLLAPPEFRGRVL
ncbi:MAG: MFS transporter, partial [Candidatus Sulfotelmatobacter sp.]